MNGVKLEISKQEMDLGVTVTDDLTPDKHINNIVKVGTEPVDSGMGLRVPRRATLLMAGRPSLGRTCSSSMMHSSEGGSEGEPAASLCISGERH
ncbi:hypothetical protein E2C01_024852 [Portunus trituberculatus]|uniref:Uncharacterized protein n=1 Tax=Portunus trituberculatus TaxID=210409 RepID=A0A5B7EDI8_PORTR|nr:hypothetical protein [Portunus trituberculatus]